MFEKDRDVLVAELRTSQIVNGHDSPGAGLLRAQIQTQVWKKRARCRKIVRALGWREMQGPLLRGTLIGPYFSLCNLEIGLFVFQDELTSRVMEELRKKDRDSLLAEIQELRKTATKKPLFEQVKHEMEKVIFLFYCIVFFFFLLPLLACFTTRNYSTCSLLVKILAPRLTCLQSVVSQNADVRP